MNNASRIEAEIDLDILLHNFREIYRRSGRPVMAVIKKDGYGHGAVPTGRILEPEEGLWGFAVATFEEGMLLRQAGLSKPILVLGHVYPKDYVDMIRADIRPAMFREDVLPALAEAAAIVGAPARVHLAVDTGMSRIGVTPDEKGLAYALKLHNTPGVILEGMFTHFARADEADKESALGQLHKFTAFRDALGGAGIEIPLAHASNSAGILQLPEAGLDMVRAGIILYGLDPSGEVRADSELRPALRLVSSIIYLKEIPVGTPVSYGGRFIATRPTRVATVSVGYGDGYPRSLSGKGAVLIRGKRAPILGRVCMDQMMVDVTDIPEAALDDPVVLIGRDGEEEISCGELGDLSGRFNYELICDLDKRIPRTYLKDGRPVEERDYFREETDLFSRDKGPAPQS